MESYAYYDSYFTTARGERGAYIVVLSRRDMERAHVAASGRRIEQNGERRRNGKKDPVYREGQGDGDRADLEGAIGEVGGQVLLADRGQRLVYTHEEWLQRRARGLTDVRGVEFRSTPYGAFGKYNPLARRSLVVHKESERDKNKHPATPYVLAVLMCEPKHGILDRPVYTGRVVFPGWCLWAEATTFGRWLPVPDWCRVERDLRPMTFLMNRLKVDHPTEAELFANAI